MCGRYVVISKLKTIEKRFRTQPIPPDLFEASANISIGNYAPVITNEQPDQIQLFQFGLTPFWAKKPMYFFNARSEGDHNKENDPHYTGAMGIVKKPAFRHCIRQKRCLIVADAFIEGPKKERLSKPFLVYLRDGKRPFALAGIWDKWVNKETAEVIHSFSIITTVANALLHEIGHHRSPVILPEELEKMWLEDIPLAEVTDMLQPYPPEEMNAYPISPAIKNPRVKDLELLQPTGDRIYKEYNYDIIHELKLEGMGMSRARIRKNEEQPDSDKENNTGKSSNTPPT